MSYCIASTYNCVTLSSAQVFQVIKCSMCTNHLTLPAVHFLCHHSFHQKYVIMCMSVHLCAHVCSYVCTCYHCSCLDDEYESECPICAPENRKVLDIIRRQMEDRELHEQFQSLVRRHHITLHLYHNLFEHIDDTLCH